MCVTRTGTSIIPRLVGDDCDKEVCMMLLWPPDNIDIDNNVAWWDYWYEKALEAKGVHPPMADDSEAWEDGELAPKEVD